MAGGYNVEEYERDVTRLRIVRAQQQQQIKVTPLRSYWEQCCSALQKLLILFYYHPIKYYFLCNNEGVIKKMKS